MFQQVASWSGCSFDHMLHVGDDWKRDMLPAMDLGMATAWVHRSADSGMRKQGADLCLFNLNPLLVYL
jgi:FMN phosphatase YigB (HAD superfamily)